MDVALFRWCSHHEVGTFGTLFAGDFKCFTIERAWLDNQPFLSCVPLGTYELRPRHYFNGGYDTWEVCDVPNRSRILIHKAAIPRHLAGCIGVGTGLGIYDGQWAITGQQAALDGLLATLDGAQSHTLTIGGFDSSSG